MKPPPPMFPAPGHVTASASPVATAASTALPPFFRIWIPMLDAMGSTDTTAAFAKETGSAAGFDTLLADFATLIVGTARMAINPIRQPFLNPVSPARNPGAPACAREECDSVDPERIPMKLRCANARGGCSRVLRAVQHRYWSFSVFRGRWIRPGVR